MKLIILLTTLMFMSAACDDLFDPKNTLKPSNQAEDLPEETQKLLECEEANIVFKDEIHPQLVKRCGDCHGSTETPTFAVSDWMQSQLVVAPLINFNAISESLLIDQSRNGHCSETSCSMDEGSGPDVLLVEALGAWKGSISACAEDEGTVDPIIDTRPIDEKEGYQYFIEEVRPALINTQSCQECHAGVSSWLYRQAFKALKYQSDRKAKNELKDKLKPLEEVLKQCEKKLKYEERIKKGRRRNKKKEADFPTAENCQETEDKIAEALKDYDTRDELYVPPEFLLGSDIEQYSKIRARMRIEENSFFASRIYVNAEGNHFGNGLCARDESPCKEIEAWWNLEKSKQ